MTEKIISSIAYKIFPHGKLSINNPNVLKKNTKQSNTTRASELIQAITIRKNDVAKEMPSDNPFSPSIRLNACDTPVVANIVNKIANGENKKR